MYAVSTTGTDNATAPFSYISPGISTNYYYVNYGSSSTLYGQGFASNEHVNLFWNYQQAGQVKVGTATAGSDGTFSFVITVPSDPALGYVNVAAIGATSKLKATTNIYEYSALILKPSSGPVGTKVHVSGGGFGSAETVTVSYQGTNVGTATTTTSGSFTFSFVVPTTTSIGYTYVDASGNTSGVSASASFIVTPTITLTPTTGPASTSVTVTGKHFSVSGYVYLYWYDPNTGTDTYFGTFNTTSTGTFKATITAPSGLTSGNTYYVQAYDGPTYILAQAAFVAQ